jgi:hypothetical protein
MTKKNKIPSPFDKFIDDQLRRQKNKVENFAKQNDGTETPQQKYNKLYREKTNNRIVWNKK